MKSISRQPIRIKSLTKYVKPFAAKPVLMAVVFGLGVGALSYALHANLTNQNQQPTQVTTMKLAPVGSSSEQQKPTNTTETPTPIATAPTSTPAATPAPATVPAPIAVDFSVSPNTNTVVRGQSLQITMQSVAGAQLVYTPQGLPSGVLWIAVPTTTPGSFGNYTAGAVTYTLQTLQTIAPGTYSVSISARDIHYNQATRPFTIVVSDPQ